MEQVEIVEDEIAANNRTSDDWLLLDDALDCLNREDFATAKLAKLPSNFTTACLRIAHSCLPALRAWGYRCGSFVACSQPRNLNRFLRAPTKDRF
jgi:hypothetical protein